ncbi:MAG: hypothetical protein HY681_00325, partial [Chloroflexi bacterium]|nr:hypothetical protein [Chloroflexota bacterium]
TQALASRDTPWWRRADALAERLDRLERVVRELVEGQGSLEESYRKGVEEAGAAYRTAVQRIEKLEEAVRDLARLVESQHPGVKADASRDSAKETHDEKPTGVKSAAVQRLVDEVNAAWANEQQATEAAERLAVHGRRLEAELQLIRDQGQTWPPGQIWSPIRHADEVGWRLRALEANLRERRRLRRWSWLGLLWARRPWRGKRLFR